MSNVIFLIVMAPVQKVKDTDDVLQFLQQNQ